MKKIPQLKPVTEKVQLPKPSFGSVKPLEPYVEPVEQINSLRQVREIIESLKQDKRILFNVIHDEMTANGGNLASPDGDLWIQQRFGYDESMTTYEIVTNQIQKNGSTTHKTP